MANRSKEAALETQRMAEILIPAIRERARRCGYAIGVHGSLSYDVDLIAAPWLDENVSSAEELAEAVLKCCEGVTGFAFIHPKEFTKKPHGRIAWSIHFGNGGYIDLSVMPRLEVPQEKQADAS